MTELKIKLVRSRIGCSPKQKAVLDALGLRKRESTRIHKDNPAIRGMIAKVVHLVEVN